MKTTTTRAGIAGLILTLIALCFVAVLAARADATDEDFVPYEVEACWTMSYSDGVENTYEFPQTRGCDLPPCEVTVEQQHDTYWVRDQGDEDYLAGLTGLSSPADDAQLEPHAYYSVILTGDPCETTPPTPTEPPVTTPPTPTDTPTPSTPATPTEPPTVTPPATPPATPPTPPATVPPSRRCIDENTIKVVHSDGTVSFVPDHGACDHTPVPPAIEEGL